MKTLIKIHTFSGVHLEVLISVYTHRGVDRCQMTYTPHKYKQGVPLVTADFPPGRLYQSFFPKVRIPRVKQCAHLCT